MTDDNILKKPGVIQTDKTKTVVIAKKQKTLPVYQVPLKYLYYNKENDRISTEIVRYTENNECDIDRLFREDREKYNQILEDIIVKSKEDAIIRTQKSISTRGQDNPGVTLRDGRVVDGNRRFSCLRRIQRERNQEQFFETIVLDYDYKDNYKYVKSLELELQMGVDEKVKYDPIDKLYGVYNSIRVKKAFTIEEYAALFDDYSVSDVKKDLAQADLMNEYLEYQCTPGKYYIAKDMDLQGTLAEIPAILEKVRRRNPDLVDDVKMRIFASIAVGADSRLNLFMRDIKEIVERGDLEKYLEDTQEAVEETERALSEKPIESYSDLSDGIRTRDDIKDKLVTPVRMQKKAMDSKKLKKAPLKISNDALMELNTIRLESISEMDDVDRNDLKDVLEKLENRIADIRSKLDT
ncbi:hypothetical protein AUQ37_04730 [Candidatus Methanomethylophilus sp. 1R26]|uniref:hypothetical protein n=1 Tax=Candidatus Methanomethylophilus sp. 1R26 TaxID=1769296 RepID=UPI000736E5A1|nr:hypothetical protein [Candidatus Methanomethylophilus sp. 1R26]KUE74308.1 hypothetical protein AUQ37_04730 [Candidatus Methanomethylophilus sp. 1R26]